MPVLDSPLNVAAYLPLMAGRLPSKPAIIAPVGRDHGGDRAYRTLTFAQLDEETDRHALGLASVGIARGMRTILMVRPGLDFFVLTFALYKIGAVPVLIDPGMGRANMVDCLRKVDAEAFIGIPLAHALRLMHSRAFRSVRVAVTVPDAIPAGGLSRWANLGIQFVSGGHALAAVRADPWRRYPVADTGPDDPAAIIFTTGSTGPPKGVLFRHAQFDAQVRILRDYFRIQPDEIDLPTFPLFALFDPALGMTAVIPDMDPTRPAEVDPRAIIEPIRAFGVTHMFGSPALLNRVARFEGEAADSRAAAAAPLLPSLRRVISAGAPVPATVLERFAALLSTDAEIFTPYGATEALPVSCIGHREILGETRHESERGGGTCVGRPVPEAEVRVIRITDDPIPEWSDVHLAPAGTVGEIVVRGPMVTREYCTDPGANARAKIRDGGAVWHRMGDLGRFDGAGRLWFCGRKAHRVVTSGGTLFSVPCEAIFNRHPRVFRSALVGVGASPNQEPVICVELINATGVDEAGLAEELRQLAQATPMTRDIRTFLIHPAFPVDIRHNAKIFREKLATWASGELHDIRRE